MASQGRLAFERVLEELSSRFIGIEPRAVDREIEVAQRLVCECFDIDLCALFQWSPGMRDNLTLSHYHRPLGGPQLPEVMGAQEYFPWCMGELRAGRTVRLASIDDAPAAAATDREVWRHYGITSVLVFPLAAGGGIFGALGFHSQGRQHRWTDEELRRLGLVARIFASALERKRIDSKLRDSQERLQLAADAADVGMWALDAATGHFWATDRARRIFAYEPDTDITVDVFLESVHPDCRTSVSEAVRRALEERREIEIEYRITHPDGAGRWVFSRGRSLAATPTSPNLLIGATIDVTERKGLESHLVEQLRFERLVSDVSARFVAVTHDDLDGEIEHALRDVGVFFGADRCALLAVSQDPRRAHVSHVWYDSGIAQVPKDLDMAGSFPWTFDRLVTRREHLKFSDLAELPAEAEPDRHSWAEQGVRSSLLLPLLAVTGLRHVLAIQCLRHARAWHESVLPRLQLLGTVVENALERRRAAEELQRSFEELERLRQRLELENVYLQQEHRLQHGGGRIVGESPEIMAVLELVEQVAPTETTVLIQGETGTGKELLAQRVHELSRRSGRPMVKVNCAALPSTLVESELFGHEKGAYTGAVSRRPGRFEIADGSTIFLDEIAELPLELQAKLLRVLEDGCFERVGSSRTLTTDVRVIAATNRDLGAEVEGKRFRSDLYYRLAVFPIEVPPLRSRRGDIPLLVWSMVQEMSLGMSKAIESIRREDMDRLQRYDWPGNVRELRNVVERALILCSGPMLRIAPPSSSPTAAEPSLSMDDVQRRHILTVLETTGGRIRGPGGAAELLGMKATTLRSRMERLGLDPRGLREERSSS